MYNNFVPKKLHAQAESLITDLEALTIAPANCPYCQHDELYVINPKSGYYRCKMCKKGFNRSLGTPFYRLSPLNWLATIAHHRLCGHGYAVIRQELDYCTSWVVKRRVRVIDTYMSENYPQLYKWYDDFIQAPKTETPKIALKQAEQLKAWVTGLLETTTANCHYCGSSNTQKVGQARAKFRCKNCWRYFNHLKGTKLEHLSRSEQWLATIDLLVAGKNNEYIKKQLNINASTASRIRSYWLAIMQEQGFLVLRSWVIGARWKQE